MKGAPIAVLSNNSCQGLTVRPAQRLVLGNEDTPRLNLGFPSLGHCWRPVPLADLQGRPLVRRTYAHHKAIGLELIPSKTSTHTNLPLPSRLEWRRVVAIPSASARQPNALTLVLTVSKRWHRWPDQNYHQNNVVTLSRRESCTNTTSEDSFPARSSSKLGVSYRFLWAQKWEKFHYYWSRNVNEYQ